MSTTPKLPLLRFTTLLGLLAPLPLFGACSAAEATGEQGSLPRGTAGSDSSTAGTSGAAGGALATGGGGSTGSAGTRSIIIDPGMQAGSGGSGPLNCGAENHQAMVKPLAIYLLVDQSASMTDLVDLWNPVVTALNTFVSDPGSAGIEVALGYFPLTSTDLVTKCDATQYVTPAVEVGMLPANTAPITTSLNAKMFQLNNPMMGPPEERLSTPTAPALTGGLQYFSGWLAQHPDHTGVMVLATDGEPAGCDPDSLAAGAPVVRGTPGELQDSVDAIAAAAAGTPAIKTYVVGIGNLMQALNQLAAAGDTGRDAFIVNSTGTSTGAEFLEAMKEIRGSALPCSFEVPLPTTGPLDYNKVNVNFQTDTTQTALPFFKVDSAEACADNPSAWHYDDPLHPNSVELCPAACEAVRAVETGSVSISLGCETRVN